MTRGTQHGAGMESPPGPVAQLETPDIETSSDGYAARFAGAVGEVFLSAQLRAAIELLEPWPNGRVLDVGGGHGQLAVPLVGRGYDVTVAGSAATCRQQLAKHLLPGTYTFEACNLFELPFPDRSFDVVTALRLLPHVTRWRRLIAELCRVARHAVIVDYPALKSVNVLADRLFGLKKAIEGDTRPYRCFEEREIVEAFGASAFGTPQFRRQFTMPMVVHRWFGNARLSTALEASARGLGLTRRIGSPVIVRLVRAAH